MKGLFEALIIYLALFFPAIFTGLQGVYSELISFSIQGLLIRLFTYTIPALILILYLLCRNESKDRKNLLFKLRIKDLFIAFIGFAGLFSISLLLSSLSQILGDDFTTIKVESPNSFIAILVMLLTCIGVGYFEESFFRLYFIQKLEKAGINKLNSIIISAILFSICHIYAGIFSLINSLLAAIFLSLLYIKSLSFHGIALAHALYNIFVYLRNF